MAHSFVAFLAHVTPRDGAMLSERTRALHSLHMEHQRLSRRISKELREARSLLAIAVSDSDDEHIAEFRRLMGAMELQVAEMGISISDAVTISGQFDQKAIAKWVDLHQDRPDAPEPVHDNKPKA